MYACMYLHRPLLYFYVQPMGGKNPEIGMFTPAYIQEGQVEGEPEEQNGHKGTGRWDQRAMGWVTLRPALVFS